ncbi:hypothetical protein VE04_06710 [Pseudogymnoascus sp. 24MN13]|nr:hypothetical protein VE04_06710 [Pseudogymnoascus sp. 24MN13]
MTPARRRSALGIRFTGVQLDELRKVSEDDVWDDMKEEFQNARDEQDFSSNSSIDGDDEDEGRIEDRDKIASSADDEFIDQTDDEEDETGRISGFLNKATYLTTPPLK